jgi:hypothetical protein
MILCLDNAPEGIISLQFASNIIASGKKAFNIILPERTYELQVEDPRERHLWIQGLQQPFIC